MGCEEAEENGVCGEEKLARRSWDLARRMALSSGESFGVRFSDSGLGRNIGRVGGGRGW